MATVPVLQDRYPAGRNPWQRRALLAAGTLAVGLAALGLVLPVLPSTCFALLAAACFTRSSERISRRLVANRWIGRHVRSYCETGRLDPNVRLLSLSALWSSLLLSVWLVGWGSRWMPVLLAAGVLLSGLLLAMGRTRQGKTTAQASP